MDINTNADENLNEGEKKMIRLTISTDEANEILNKIDAPTPDASEIDEIILIVKT